MRFGLLFNLISILFFQARSSLLFNLACLFLSLVCPFFPPFLPCALVKICFVLRPLCPCKVWCMVYCFRPLCPCKVWCIACRPCALAKFGYSIPGNYIQPSVFNLAQNGFYWPRNIGVQEFKKSIKNGSCQYDSGLSLGNSSETFPPKFLAFCWLAANESTKNHQGKPWFAAIFERQQKYQPTKEWHFYSQLFQLDDEPNHYMKNGCFTKTSIKQIVFFGFPSWIFKQKFTKAWSLESDLKREMTDRSRQAGFRA